MKKFILTLGALMVLASPAMASQIVNVSVDGMVCDFCAQSVLKVFEDSKDVENIDINLDEGLVIISVRDGGTLSDDEIKEKIHYAGYDLKGINRAE